MVDCASYQTRPSSPIVPTALVSHMLYILSLRLYTDLSFINYVPASHPLVDPSLRLPGRGGWLRADALARPSIDFAGELVSRPRSTSRLNVELSALLARGSRRTESRS